MDYNIRSTITLNNGVEMPRFGLGVWQVENEEELRGSVKAALDAGYWHIDTAEAYENEDMVGRAIADFADRKDLFVTTKLWNKYHERAEEALEESLKKLQMDQVDLFLIHWPSPKVGNFRKAWKSLVKLQEQGLTRAIGVSNFKPHHIEQIIEDTGVVPAINQVERHPLFQQDELAAYCRAKGIVMEGYSPLATGHLGEFAPILQPIAEKYGKTPAQVALRWHLQTDWVLIPKSITPSRVVENAQIFDFSLDEEDMKIIKGIDKNEKFLPDADEATF